MDWENYSSLDLPIVNNYDDRYEKLSWGELNELCLKNDLTALYEKASRLRLGEGVEENRNEAINCYYDLLKLQRNTRALYNLGLMLKEDDNIECFEVFKCGSLLGDADCSCELGYLYRYGDYVDIDMEEATRCFELSYEQGNSFALVAAGEMYLEVNDYDRAFQLFTKAYQKGDTSAAYYMGRMYYWGMGVEESDEAAFPYLKMASDDDIKEANAMLGGLYGFGYGTEKNVELALKCLDNVAENDLAYSYNIKGRIFISEGDDEEGKKWLEKAAELGDEDAQELLSEGVGKTDKELAESGEDPYAMIRYSIKMMENKDGEGGLSKAVEVISRAYELYPDNLDVREQYANMLLIRGYVQRQVGATADSYNTLRKCLDEVNQLHSMNHHTERLQTIEIDAYMECGESAYEINNDNVALEMFSRTDHDKYPYAVVLMALIHMQNSGRFSANLADEIHFLESALNSDKWREDKELAMAYYILSANYAMGITGYLNSDVARGYSLIQKCATIDSKMADLEMKKYSKNLFGKITYKP